MMAQYYPGRTKYPNSNKDGTLRREEAFKECLSKVSNIPGLKSLALPYKIGCNLAGGDWVKYRHMIRQFAENNPNVKVRVYKLPGAK